MASKLQSLQAYLSGRADAETAAEVEAAWADPQSLLTRGLGDALRRREDAAPENDWYGRLMERERAAQGGDDGPSQPSTPAGGRPARRAKSSARPLYAAAAALAACLLVAVGVGLGRGGGREVAFAAVVTARAEPARGPGTVAEVAVENRSDRKAYLTIVGLAAARRPAVHYREEQQFIDVAAQGTRTVRSLPEGFDGCPAALVVLTATPAGEVVRGLAAEPVAPAQAEEARGRLQAALEAAGYRGVAVEVVRLGPPGP
jgi:hypothetical protein